VSRICLSSRACLRSAPGVIRHKTHLIGNCRAEGLCARVGSRTVPGEKCYGSPSLTSAASSTNTVHPVLAEKREFHVHHVRDPLDVQPTCRDVLGADVVLLARSVQPR
jgi:hypothetical protein